MLKAVQMVLVNSYSEWWNKSGFIINSYIKW